MPVARGEQMEYPDQFTRRILPLQYFSLNILLHIFPDGHLGSATTTATPA
jgi:hypothetical protein